MRSFVPLHFATTDELNSTCKMKRSMVFLLLLALGAGGMMGQAPPNCFRNLFKDHGARLTLLDYDLDSLDQGDRLGKVAHQGKAIVKIKNVNPLVYQVEVAGASLTYNTDVPDLWSQWMLKGGAAEKNDIAKTQMLAAPPAPGITQSLQTSIQNLADATVHLEKLKPLMDDLQSIAYSPNTTAANAKVNREAWLKMANAALGNTGTPVLGLGAALHKVYDEWKSATLKVETDYAILPSRSTADQLAKAKADLLQAQVKSTDYQKLIADMLRLYDLLDQGNFTYTSEPIYPDQKADALKIDIKIKPRSSLKNAEDFQSYQFSRTLPIAGGWKFDFSSGIGISNLVDQSFALGTADSSGTRQLLAEVKQGTGFGVNAFLHAHYRSARSVTVGLAMGAMVDDSKRPRYLAGGSILIGRQQRLIANLGLAYGKVNLLSNTQKVGDFLPKETRIATVERYRFGFFAGLSFNLSN
jgi:hypothetical protein